MKNITDYNHLLWGYGDATLTYVDAKLTPILAKEVGNNGYKGTNGVCNKIIAENETDELIVYMDDIRLGKRKYIGDEGITAHTSGEKTYFNLNLSAKLINMSENMNLMLMVLKHYLIKFEAIKDFCH